MSRALRQRGIAADVIEKHAGWNVPGAGIGLPSNSVRAFDRLGSLAPLLAKAHRVEQLEYALASGETLSIASLTQPPFDNYPCLALPRRDLIGILADGVENVRFQTQVRKLTQTHNKVTVELSGAETAHYDLVIAADGIHSETRKSMFPRARLQDMGATNWRFLIARDAANMHPVYYLGKDDAFMLYPIAPDRVYCYGHVADYPGVYLNQSPLPVLKKRFHHHPRDVVSAIEGVRDEKDIIIGRVESVHNTEAVYGRVVLIGDALHGCPPTLQQGAGQALEDALCLAPLLAEYSVDEALTRYQRIRLPLVQSLVQVSNKIMKLGLLGKHWPVRVLRNAKIRRTGPLNVSGWRALMNAVID